MHAPSGGTLDRREAPKLRAVASCIGSSPDPELLLSRLEGVRKSQNGWTARCPAHADRHASLSVAVGDQGRLLAHCFSGCSIGQVLGAVGLSVSDLFPRRITEALPESNCETTRDARARKRLERSRAVQFAALSGVRAAAGVLALEAGIVLIAAGDTANGNALSAPDLHRLALAFERIQAARLALGGVR